MILPNWYLATDATYTSKTACLNSVNRASNHSQATLGVAGALLHPVASCTQRLQPAAQLADEPHIEGFPTDVQISANGRTTSLGDHDTQEAAAAAFDRAAINKDGAAAKTNFDRDNYAAEMTVLTSAIAAVSKSENPLCTMPLNLMAS